MKKLIAVFSLIMLCSCGSSPDQAVIQSEPEIKTAEAAVIETTVAEGTTTVTEITETTKSPQEQELDDLMSQYDYFKSYDYEKPLNVYEDDNISVVTDWWVVADYTFSTRLIIENKTDKDIIIKSDNSSINDFDIDLHVYDHIAAGKKKVVFAECDPDELEQYMQGKDINCIELRFEGSDENTYSELFETDVITITIEQ